MAGTPSWISALVKFADPSWAATYVVALPPVDEVPVAAVGDGATGIGG